MTPIRSRVCELPFAHFEKRGPMSDHRDWAVLSFPRVAGEFGSIRSSARPSEQAHPKMHPSRVELWCSDDMTLLRIGARRIARPGAAWLVAPAALVAVALSSSSAVGSCAANLPRQVYVEAVAGDNCAVVG